MTMTTCAHTGIVTRFVGRLRRRSIVYLRGLFQITCWMQLIQTLRARSLLLEPMQADVAT